MKNTTNMAELMKKVNAYGQPQNLDEGFASDAQKRAAFAQGYKAKGKKDKKDEEVLDEAKATLSRFGGDRLKSSIMNLAKQRGLKVKDLGKDKIEISGNQKVVMAITLAVQKKDVKINEEAELDESLLPLFFALYGVGAMVVLPGLIVYDMMLRNKGSNLDDKVSKVVGNLVSKFKKDKNYKPTSAEIDAAKKLEKEAKSKEPNIFKKAMEKLKSIKSKSEEVDIQEDGHLDKVNPAAVKKKFKDRKDKDIDNDGDVDSSDEYLHKRRKAVSQADLKNWWDQSVRQALKVNLLPCLWLRADRADWKVAIPDVYAHKNKLFPIEDFNIASIMSPELWAAIMREEYNIGTFNTITE